MTINLKQIIKKSELFIKTVYRPTEKSVAYRTSAENLYLKLNLNKNLKLSLRML
jgi:hypothetical protein